MHEIMNKKFYLGPKFGTLFNNTWITISELLHLCRLIAVEFTGSHKLFMSRKPSSMGIVEVEPRQFASSH
jgi:hypothetical protein